MTEHDDQPVDITKLPHFEMPRDLQVRGGVPFVFATNLSETHVWLWVRDQRSVTAYDLTPEAAVHLAKGLTEGALEIQRRKDTGLIVAERNLLGVDGKPVN